MPEPSTHKERLRRKLRQRRRELTPAEQDAAARGVCRDVPSLPGWRQASHLALYMAADGEVDTGTLAELCREQGKLLYLPVIRDDLSLEFARWHGEDRLIGNRYGIPEPPASAGRRGFDQLDMVFVPLVGWDRKGNRLGMGGGFYDRSLAAGKRALLVGLGHACQEVEDIPRERWDVRLDFVATGSSLVKCQGNA